MNHSAAEESKKRISTILAWAMANSTGALSSHEYRSPKVCPSTAFCISVFGTLGDGESLQVFGGVFLCFLGIGS